MKIVRCLFIFLAACGGSSTPPVDEWMLVRVNGARSGYEHITRTVEGKVIRTERSSEMRIKRFNTELMVRQESVYEETPDGAPIRFTEKMLLSDRDMVFTGQFKGSKLILTTTIGTNANSKELDWKSDWLFPAARDRLIRDNVASGKDITFTEYSVEFGKPATTTMRPKGKDGEHFRFEVAVDVKKDLLATEWRDAQGRLVKQTASMMGMDIVAERSDKASALTTGTSEVPEVFIKTTITPKQKFAEPSKLTEALYRITLKEGTLEEKSFVFNGQKVERAAGSTLHLRVRPVTPSSSRSLPIQDTTMKPYLQSNVLLQCDDPGIVQASKQAVGNETDAWKAARAIEAWVRKNVTNKTMGVAFADAKQVLERREGDCTEHSVLSAAMCRAAGIPSRVAIGLAAVRDFFGGHMWTEVWVGEWVPIDATLGMDASHIKMGESSLNESGIAGEFMNVLVYLGRIELDVLEYEADGQRVTPQ
jgi:hypothetical protein